MYAKALIISLMIAVGVVTGVLHSPGISAEKEDLAKLYERSIDKMIEKCESQADLLHTSRSVTLRNYANLQDKKAQFLDAEKEMLINIMIQRRLEPKQYKIEHFLDGQFYRSTAK